MGGDQTVTGAEPKPQEPSSPAPQPRSKKWVWYTLAGAGVAAVIGYQIYKNYSTGEALFQSQQDITALGGDTQKNRDDFESYKKNHGEEHTQKEKQTNSALEDLGNRVGGAEKKLSGIEGKVRDVGEQVDTLKGRVDTLEKGRAPKVQKKPQKSQYPLGAKPAHTPSKARSQFPAGTYAGKGAGAADNQEQAAGYVQKPAPAAPPAIDYSARLPNCELTVPLEYVAVYEIYIRKGESYSSNNPIQGRYFFDTINLNLTTKHLKFRQQWSPVNELMNGIEQRLKGGSDSFALPAPGKIAHAIIASDPFVQESAKAAIRLKTPYTRIEYKWGQGEKGQVMYTVHCPK